VDDVALVAIVVVVAGNVAGEAAVVAEDGAAEAAFVVAVTEDEEAEAAFVVVVAVVGNVADAAVLAG
jgi:hypothetical protein